MESFVPSIVKASAAAILATGGAIEYVPDDPDEPVPRFVVNPYVATIDHEDPLLMSYLVDIYQKRKSMPVELASSTAFRMLAKASGVKKATKRVADDLATTMQSTTANPGIVFGFLLQNEGNGDPRYGIIKADLDDTERFQFDGDFGSEWTLEQVRDLLPAPSNKFAKFAIAPRPRGLGAMGIRDLNSRDEAAEYFLESLGVTIERTADSKLQIARAAARAGYSRDEIEQTLSSIDKDMPIVDLVTESFPNIGDAGLKRLGGSDRRPRKVVSTSEGLHSTIEVNHPHLKIVYDVAKVSVVENGNRITIELPPDRSETSHRYGD